MDALLLLRESTLVQILCPLPARDILERLTCVAIIAIYDYRARAKDTTGFEKSLTTHKDG